MKQHLIKITKNFQITLPAGLRKKFKISEGDYLEAVVKNSAFVFTPKKIVEHDPDQAWFWDEKWQKLEREADQDLQAGRMKGPFKNINEALKALKKG